MSKLNRSFPEGYNPSHLFVTQGILTILTVSVLAVVLTWAMREDFRNREAKLKKRQAACPYCSKVPGK